MIQPEPQPSLPGLQPRSIEAVRSRALLGVPLSMTDYEEAMEVMDGLVASRERGYVCATPVHALMVAQDDYEMMSALRGATMVVPDGMPLVWASNLLGETLEDRVYGPELMRRYSERCAERGHRVWLYGGRDQGSLVQLALSLRRNHPDIRIVGGYSPPFRPLGEQEEHTIAQQINEAKPDVLWVGIGVPKQEKWMAHMRDRLDAVAANTTKVTARIFRRRTVSTSAAPASASTTTANVQSEKARTSWPAPSTAPRVSPRTSR